jgi:tetratricopeptide (TPR) repeat protein
MRTAAKTLLLALAALSFYLAYADFLFRSGSPTNIQTAARLVPFHPEYQAALGNSQRSLELNPYNTALRIELALDAEARGELTSAERQLLEATRFDQRFALRWALANFYFRQQRQADFWKWYRLAAERSYDDRRALFSLAWRQTTDAQVILQALPPDPPLRLAYLRFLLEENRIDALQKVALDLLPQATPADLPLLLDTAEKQLATGHLPEALILWNSLIKRELLNSRAALDPTAGVFLSDPAVRNEAISKAFDWRLLWRSGVASHWTPGQFQITLEGTQATPTDLLEIAIPLDPQTRTYDLRFRYRTEGIRSGLAWRAFAHGDAKAPIAVARHTLSAEDWQVLTVRLDCPPQTTWMRLVLFYERQPGTVRQEGTLRIGQFQLTPTRSGSPQTTTRTQPPAASTTSAGPTPNPAPVAKAAVATRTP